MNISETHRPYALQAPSPQQTLDIFKGSWASRLPGTFANLSAGTAALFEDPRVNWAIETLQSIGVDVGGSAILELGPLEGGHTFQLAKAGARSITAVEAHQEAFLKCLLLKELLSVERVNFLFGDGVEFLRNIGHTYDIGFASGFLYHMANPVELIELLCRRTKAVFLWTVYYTDEFVKENAGAHAGSGEVTQSTHAGFTHTLHRHSYGEELCYSQFWGGPKPHSNWMEKDEILKAFAYFGFTKQIAEFETNPNGAALRMVATAG